MDIQEFIRHLSNELHHNNLIQAVFSSPIIKEKNNQFKVSIRKLKNKNNDFIYQITSYIDQKVFHKNVDAKTAIENITSDFLKAFNQCIFQMHDHDYHVFMNKKSGYKIIVKKPTRQDIIVEHNRTKNYIFQEGQPLPFLVELGIMNAEGYVLAARQDKFKQINRFLETIADITCHLEKKKHVSIVDYGCGKAYLTFALFYYLKEVKKLNVSIFGLDLKSEIIDFCNQLAQKYNYHGLHFQVGDINSHDPQKKIDMVVALHACNTATDAALAQAVKWNADVILAAPCCQHELYKQVKNDSLDSLLRHGILRERFSALATDALRADVLEFVGYHTQVIEFIDSEHTPKNLLIKAVKGNSEKDQQRAFDRYRMMCDLLHAEPSLKKMLDQ